MACTKIKTGQSGNFVLTLLEDYGVFVETKAVTSAADDYYIEIRTARELLLPGPIPNSNRVLNCQLELTTL